MRGRSRCFTALGFFVAFFCVFIPAGPTNAQVSEKSAGEIATPVPEEGKETPKKRKIRREVHQLLKDPAIAAASVGIYVKSLASGKVLYRRNSDRLFIPASTNKLIIGAAALGLLGQKFRFLTEVWADAPINAEGTLEGNLYIKGKGDPSLAVEEVWLLAHQIHGLGLRRVTGNVVGDDSYFEAVKFYDSWGFKSPRSYAAPMGALSFNWNKVQAYVTPASQAGAPAHVTLNPENDYFTLENRIRTCDGCRTIISLNLKERVARASGKIDLRSAPMTAFASVADPLPVAIHSIKTMLEREGVVVVGDAVGGVVPEGAKRIFVHESRELNLIIRYLYRFSNNLTAEHILKVLGAEQYGGQATREKGCRAVMEYLKDNGIYQAGTVIDDGSGLSRENRQSPKSLVKTLVHVAESPEFFPEYLEALAIGGVDGTLRYRFANTPLERRVRAKTGYLYGVVTLAGYAWNSAGEPYAFAIFINNPPPKTKVGVVKNKVDRILLTLMQ